MKRHQFDSVSFIFGALFVVLGALFAASTSPWRLLVVDLRWHWVGPTLLIALGLLILLPILRRGLSPAEHPGPPPDGDDTGSLSDLDADDGESADLEAAAAELVPDPLDPADQEPAP